MGHVETIPLVGRSPDMLLKIESLLTKEGYSAIGETNKEEAFVTFRKHSIDAVIMSGGVDSESRKLFHKEFPKINPVVKIIDAHPQTVLNELKKAFPD